MGKIAGIILLLLVGLQVYGQEELPATIQQSMEAETAATTAVSEDDEQWQLLQERAHHRISLNTADAEELTALGILLPHQVESLLQYRQLLGDFVSIYELQAVPGFDISLIKQLLPYISTDEGFKPRYQLRDLFSKGGKSLLVRYGRQLEASKGYLSANGGAKAYQGSIDKVFIRYRYNLTGYTSYGISMEKDPGEAFFRGAQRYGFDFYSAHLFISNYRHVKAVAVGDFTVNMGQGLLQWHSHAAGKSAAVLQVKKEGEVLRPYTSSGEYYFFRGTGVTMQVGKVQLTAFGSLRKLDGTVAGADTLTDGQVATALQSAGYHRTSSEIAKMNAVTQFSSGAVVRYMGKWNLGANIIYHHLSPGLEKPLKPYNQFDFRGNGLVNYSLDYSRTLGNMHLFGELARDQQGRLAGLQGALISMSANADFSLVYRNYDKAYQSFYSKGFGENYNTRNEQGIYMGCSLRPTSRWLLSGYVDWFQFPWLRYGVNFPSGGWEYLLQLSWTCKKNVMFSGRVLSRKKDEAQLTHIRFQADITGKKKWATSTRFEYAGYNAGGILQPGILFYEECSYKPRRLPVQLDARVGVFHTGGYQSRVYAYESSVMYENSVGQYYGDGWQYYLNLKWKLDKNITCWGRIHQVIYPGKQRIGSGWDMIQGNKKTMLQFQLIYAF
ncbi:MAG: helix-hairpin-helix domain-containing protein [Chitinophaga sp.]|uniref:ComEA family DNA-binding protein n=1 Tax=Chitinophaga sp. TaxID=1869181 RepID=UPI0025C5C186|nr:helix-hairpin-helix domain-containing protein [Chitinophaga sp.]MBV8253841.1 helix-hairpin-helix domain-containing protein [Chitinophaga sp.]